jgi:hypothetical protein
MLINTSFAIDYFLKALNGIAARNTRTITMTVRGFTDSWIASGILANGDEKPKSRILSESVLASLRSLTDTPLAIAIMPNGAVQGQFTFAPRHRPNLMDRQALKKSDYRYGIYLFLSFLDGGDLRFRLAKCQHHGCGAPYFWRKRLRETYKREARCPHHLRQAAGNRTRESEREGLLGLAAEFWPQWTEREHPNRALWIAEQMNEKRKATERRITQKWVSRNIDVRTGKVKDKVRL